MANAELKKLRRKRGAKAWHEGPETRVVLIVDIWHPDLTDAEAGAPVVHKPPSHAMLDEFSTKAVRAFTRLLNGLML